MVSGGIAEKPIKLGKDEFFVLGDNRNDSIDSRDGESVGVVQRKNIDGLMLILRIIHSQDLARSHIRNKKA